MLIISQITFRDCRVRFFPTTFLETAVYRNVCFAMPLLHFFIRFIQFAFCYAFILYLIHASSRIIKYVISLFSPLELDSFASRLSVKFLERGYIFLIRPYSSVLLLLSCSVMQSVVAHIQENDVYSPTVILLEERNRQKNINPNAKW